MPNKLSKKLIDALSKSSGGIKRAERKHKKCMDSIIDVVKPFVFKQRGDSGVGSWTIKSVEIRNDEEIDYKYRKGKDPFEYIDITEKEYDSYTYRNRGSGKIPHYGEPPKGFEEEFVCDYIFEPEYKEIYKKRIEKRYEYLRVIVYETWRYGGEDWVTYDFLLPDILDDVSLRKYKLKKLMEDTNNV